MKIYFKLTFITLVLSLVSYFNLFGQASERSERTIHLMRAKQFYGSGVKMNLLVNGEPFYELKSGSRLVIKSNPNDTLNFQVVYPLGKNHKSEVLQVVPDGDSEVYIDLFYWGEGYNPLKHAGPIRGSHGGSPEFNIEIVRMTQKEGKLKFEALDSYKDNEKIPERSILVK